MSTLTALSHYTEAAFLKWLTQNTDMPTPPATLYIALYTVMPAEDGTGGTEVSTGGGSNYARQAMSSGTHNTGSGSAWSALSTDSTSTTVSNAIDELFPAAGTNWGTIVGAVLWDASSSGNMMFYGASTASVAITIGDQYRIAAGQLSLNLA